MSRDQSAHRSGVLRVVQAIGLAGPGPQGQRQRDEPAVIRSYALLQIKGWSLCRAAILEFAALCRCVTGSSCLHQGVATAIGPLLDVPLVSARDCVLRVALQSKG